MEKGKLDLAAMMSQNALVNFTKNPGGGDYATVPLQSFIVHSDLEISIRNEKRLQSNLVLTYPVDVFTPTTSTFPSPDFTSLISHLPIL